MPKYHNMYKLFKNVYTITEYEKRWQKSTNILYYLVKERNSSLNKKKRYI